MDAISSLGTNHVLCGFSPFSQENPSKSKLFPVMSLDLKEHPMVSTEFTNQTLTAFSSSSVTPVSKNKTIKKHVFLLLNFCGFMNYYLACD